MLKVKLITSIVKSSELTLITFLEYGASDLASLISALSGQPMVEVPPFMYPGGVPPATPPTTAGAAAATTGTTTGSTAQQGQSRLRRQMYYSVPMARQPSRLRTIQRPSGEIMVPKYLCVIPY